MSQKIVEMLLNHAADATDADQAVGFALAAFHAANTLRVLSDMRPMRPPGYEDDVDGIRA
jgi:hypothetical protein